MTASGNEERIGKSAKVQKFVAEGKGLTQEEVKEIEKVGKGIHFRAYVRFFFSPLSPFFSLSWSRGE